MVSRDVVRGFCAPRTVRNELRTLELESDELPRRPHRVSPVRFNEPCLTPRLLRSTLPLKGQCWRATSHSALARGYRRNLTIFRSTRPCVVRVPESNPRLCYSVLSTSYISVRVRTSSWGECDAEEQSTVVQK